MTIGEKIHALRIQHGMTMDDLARELGVQRSAINKYEKGIVVNLKRSTISSLCRVFGVSPSYFLDDSESLRTSLSQEDLDRLESLHQDPRLCLLFDHSRKMKPEDVDYMLRWAEFQLKQLDGE